MTATAEREVEPMERGSKCLRVARWIVRGACLVAAVAAMLRLPQPSRVGVLVPALSPFVALASLLAARALQATAVLGLAVGAVALVRRRWFCRWACPTGLCAECAGRLGRCVGSRSPPLPQVGRGIALMTLAGACLGYPLLLWLDPLAMFCGLFSLTATTRGPAVWWSAVGLPAVLLMSVLLPGAWCARLCPLGAVQELLWLVRGAVRSALLGSDGQPATRPGRREFFGMAAWTAVGLAWAAAARRVHAGAARPLRPPGAVDEAKLAGLCIRCGNCVRACPTKIIEPDSGTQGIAGLLLPVISFQQDYCREDCTGCMDVCPSGALERCPKDDKVRARIGLPRVDLDICRLSNGEECSACRNRCPYEAVSFVSFDGGYNYQPQVDPDKCPGCGACEVACPTQPAKAIVVAPR